MNKIKIKRKCKPGETNVNGLVYDLESYNNAIERFGERIKYGISAELFLCPKYRYMDELKRQSFYFVNPENCCGKIIDVTDEYIVVEPNSTDRAVLFNNIINDGVELSAYMRYIGDNTITPAKVINIITFDIMPDEDINVVV